jgi:hypothetical protein
VTTICRIVASTSEQRGAAKHKYARWAGVTIIFRRVDVAGLWGTLQRVFLKSIQEIAAEPVTLMPEDERAERANTHWLGATTEERSALSVDQVLSAFLETGQALQHRVSAAGFDGTATFYVWHDEQAGQLRCSVSSRTPTDLPFGGNYQPTDDLSAIVAGFLSDDTPGFVPWEDLEPVDGIDPEDDHYPPFPVWTFDLKSGR